MAGLPPRGLCRLATGLVKVERLWELSLLGNHTADDGCRSGGMIQRFAAYGSKVKRMFPPSPPDRIAVRADECNCSEPVMKRPASD